MDENAAFDRLQAYLTKIENDAVLLDPGRERLNVIARSHQSGPTPPGPYAVIYYLAESDPGEANCATYADATIAGQNRVIKKISRSILWRFRVDVFAANAMDYASRFQRALDDGSSAVDLAPLTVRLVHEATRVPELKQARWQGRAQFDVELGGIRTERILVDVIESGDFVFTADAGATARFNRTLPYQKV